MTRAEQRLATSEYKANALRLKLKAIYNRQNAARQKFEEKMRREYGPAAKALLESECDVARAKLGTYGITPMHTIVEFQRHYGRRFAFTISRHGWFEVIPVLKDGTPGTVVEKYRCLRPDDRHGMTITNKVLMLGDK